MFGPNNITACHGLILTAWSIGAVGGGLLFTNLFNSYVDKYGIDHYLPYVVNIWWIFGVVSFGFVLVFFIRSLIRDRLFPAVPGQIFRVRIFGRMVRLVRGDRLRLEILSPEQETNEWEEYLMLCIIKLRLVKNDTLTQAAF
ncbi:hypothetical protein IWQ62_006215 [Dispira parvispora]|uniref:Uncharacterized protein n=1 Tax=Dispira parvispora TaxID=1520584 RepID=A0A9W8AL84_9FUNG|nr:hypothetical protein IWQ62_006215 [Dispira parvispora]